MHININMGILKSSHIGGFLIFWPSIPVTLHIDYPLGENFAKTAQKHFGWGVRNFYFPEISSTEKIPLAYVLWI